jgi:ABC-type antimicrobial peptide transport system permease subunit
MAPGAARRDVTKLLLRSAVQQAGIGLALGFLLSLLISRWLGRVVIGVSPTDPVTLSGVSALLAFAALAAGYIPARRATQVDPATALREE